MIPVTPPRRTSDFLPVTYPEYKKSPDALCALAVLAAMLWANPAASQETAAMRHPDSQPATREVQDRIAVLISQLKWSRPVGPAHMPFVQIPGNDSARELVGIGRPAVHPLVKALTQIEPTSPLLTRRPVAAVLVLGEIGDSDAVPGILRALKANDHDIFFIQAAVQSLGKLGDPRAIPVLKKLAALSFEVAAVTKLAATNGGGAPRGTPEEVRWWVEKSGIAGVNMTWEGVECYEAIAGIDPDAAFGIAAKSIGSSNSVERMAAIMGINRVVEKDPTYRELVVDQLTKQQKVEKDDQLTQLIGAALTELSRRPTSRPSAATGSPPAAN